MSKLYYVLFADGGVISVYAADSKGAEALALKRIAEEKVKGSVLSTIIQAVQEG